MYDKNGMTSGDYSLVQPLYCKSYMCRLKSLFDISDVDECEKAYLRCVPLTPCTHV